MVSLTKEETPTLSALLPGVLRGVSHPSFLLLLLLSFFLHIR